MNLNDEWIYILFVWWRAIQKFVFRVACFELWWIFDQFVQPAILSESLTSTYTILTVGSWGLKNDFFLLAFFRIRSDWNNTDYWKSKENFYEFHRSEWLIAFYKCDESFDFNSMTISKFLSYDFHISFIHQKCEDINCCHWVHYDFMNE